MNKNAKLYLIRGIPGSGKSTYANQLENNIRKARRQMNSNDIVSDNIIHLEADMYHVYNGNYQWNPEKVRHAHDWCFNTTRIFLEQGFHVIVANTFTRYSEMQNYLKHARKYNIPYDVYRATGKWKNVHNVPDETVERMIDRFEDFEGEFLV